MVGSRLSHYRIESELGAGGMGVVYEAVDEKLGRKVAIKLLPALTSRDPGVRDRFENEARAASSLDHPNICTIYQIGEGDEGQLFIAMALYRGVTLEERLKSGPIPVEEAVRIASEIASGLKAAHGAGIIHRDIKPGNVMLTDDGRVIILDFGLAKVENTDLTQEGQSVGTVTYMSPEQAQGQPMDVRSDIWSLGAVFYEMVAGEKPFPAEYSQAILYRIVNDDPVPVRTANPDTPADVADLIEACLRKDPAVRVQSAGDFLGHLQGGAVDEERVAAYSLSRTIGIAAATALVLAAVFFALLPDARQSLLDGLGLGGLPEDRHIAVMVSRSDDETEDDRALESGLVESLTDAIQRASSGRAGIWVVPSSRVARANLADAADARSQFGVNLVIVVDVAESAEGYRLSLDLVDPGTERTLRRAERMIDRSESNRIHGILASAASSLIDLELDIGTSRLLAATSSQRPGAAEFYTQGRGYLNQFSEGDNLEASILLFERAIEADSSYALAYAGLCASYWRLWERNEDPSYVTLAEQNCERALELESDLTSVYVTLGRLHTGTGRYGTAIGEYRLALARDSSDIEALIGLASVYDELDRLDEAEATYKRAIDMKPDYWFAYSNLGVFYFNQARYEDAIEQFLIVADLNPFNARAYANIGAIYFYLDRRQDAIDAFERALAIRDDLGAWSNLATLYYYEGQYADAAEAFEEALELSDGGSFDTWGYLATAYKWSGQPEKAREADMQAIRLATQALEINPRDQEVMAHLASYHASVGQADSARIFLDRVIALNPSDPQEMSRIGETYELLGERKLAIEWTERALANGYALAEIVDYPGFEDMLADPDFQLVLDAYRDTDTQAPVADPSQ